MAIALHSSRLGLGSAVAFVTGWFVFGLIGAIFLAVAAMLFLGIITVDGKAILASAGEAPTRPPL